MIPVMANSTLSWEKIVFANNKKAIKDGEKKKKKKKKKEKKFITLVI